MTTRSGSLRAPPWLLYVGFVTLLVGVIGQALTYSYNYGQLSAKVDRNVERIVKLEVTNDQRADADRRRDERGARIEAKLDLLLPDRERAEKRP